jgi:hypothetical protein
LRYPWPLLVAVPAVVAIACAMRPRVCMSVGDCGANEACVAGRCVSTNASVKPAVMGEGVVRLVAEPTEMAYLRPGDAPGAGTPHIVTLGKDTDARLFLRFNVPLPSDSEVVEAYLLLNRSDEVDSDPVPPIALHAARITDPWDARSISWALQPHVEDTRSAATYVTQRSVVRLKVVDLVAEWPRHDPKDQGLAVVADAINPTGMAFALASDATNVDPRGTSTVAPRLEIYVKMPSVSAASSLPTFDASAPIVDAGRPDAAPSASAPPFARPPSYKPKP